VWAGALALAAHERRAVPDAAREAPAEGPLDVVAVVPARDEARDVGDCVASLLAQRPPLRRVVVVDDGSADGTAEVALAAGAGDPRLAVVPAGPLPAGWVGKNRACHVGVGAAGPAEWLLFTDADVVHGPGTLARTVGLARRTGRGGVTLMPRVVCGTRAERWVLPAALVAIGTFVAPGPLARSPRSHVAIAAGGYVLIRRDLYERVGGHAALRSRMVDDVTLAERVKRAGGLLVTADGSRLVSLRMYRGAGEVWAGWRKNASFAVAGPPPKAVVAALLLATAAVAPPLALAMGAARGRPRTAAWGLAGVAAQAALQRMAARNIPTPAGDAPTLPVGLLVLAAAAVRGAADRAAGRGALWRGRHYPAAR
jgi:hypothetical protein